MSLARMSDANDNLVHLSARKAYAIARTIELLKGGDPAVLEMLVHKALQAQPLEIADLWEPSELPLTYWILLLSGVNQTDECEIAKTVVFWNTFFSKHSARVVCLQSSERPPWRLCTSSFNIANCPTLVLADSPHGYPFIRFGPEFLFSLLEQPGGLQRFLTKVHALVESGHSLQQISSQFSAEKFWKQIKLGYKELKEIVSVSITFESGGPTKP